MKNWNAFYEKGRFYKGCLHTHTNRSDGAFDVEKTIELYRERSYDFLSITDHNIFHNKSENTTGMVMIPGVESDMVIPGDKIKVYHMVGIGTTPRGYEHDERFTFHGKQHTGQSMLDALNQNTELVFLAHPIWSHTEYEDHRELNGLWGMEVFNTGCFLENDTGYSHTSWHKMLLEGHRIYGVATDDAHHIHHFGGGHVMVKAKEGTAESIMDALYHGSFYASSGPELYDLYLEDNVMHVSCSPCKRIHLIADHVWHGCQVVQDPSGNVTSASFVLDGKSSFYRVECIDAEYNMAWSQPYWND